MNTLFRVERWEGKQKMINDEQVGILNQITKLKEEETKYFELYINILDLARRAKEIYENKNRTPEERRLLLSHIFSNLFLKDKKASGLLKKSPKVLEKRVQQRIATQKNFELKKLNKDKVESTFDPKNDFVLPLVDKFRTANWAGIKSDLQFSGILGLFPMLELQN